MARHENTRLQKELMSSAKMSLPYLKQHIDEVLLINIREFTSVQAMKKLFKDQFDYPEIPVKLIPLAIGRCERAGPGGREFFHHR